MLNTSQIPDNPGYVDFNEPAPIISIKKEKPNKRAINQKRVNLNENEKWSRGGSRRFLRPTPPMFLSSRRYNYRNEQIPISRPPPMSSMRPSIPSLGPLNSDRFGHRPIIPSSLLNRSLIPPIPPLILHRAHIHEDDSISSRPHLISRNGSGGPMRRNRNIQSNRKNEGKGRRRSQNKSGQKGKKTFTKTLNEIINQYPLDKSWVTDEIKEEHKKKEDIENKLKCNRDDKLFAEFKMQRNKFVNLYEAARLEYIGKHSEKVR